MQEVTAKIGIPLIGETGIKFGAKQAWKNGQTVRIVRIVHTSVVLLEVALTDA